MSTTNGVLAAALMAAALLGGCASSGMGGGDIVRPGKAPDPVLFSWQSRDGSIDGTMTATTSDATYQGRFMQITQQTVADSLAPMWDAWPMGWSDWPYDGWAAPMVSVEQFVTVYSGRVIANMRSVDGRSMRCRLQLVQPDMGMKGGGDGQCQIAGGPSFHASF
ncbi:hypothetical protein [Variovorax sp. GT1P44]|uniref:hypothetical protein n=1 Tax=Variovorax sp. GT1P44 TaxID=3443742 RepID=UPI003F47F08B